MSAEADATRKAQLPLFDALPGEPEIVRQAGDATPKRYVYAFVHQGTREIQLPVYASRQAAREQLQWQQEADELKIERCRLVMCRRERRGQEIER